MPLDKHELFATLPAEWPEDVLPEIRRRLQQSKQKVIVLDDDPTGTQTVHGVPVLTEWSVESLRTELANDLPAFYILTNSRAMTPDDAQRMMAEIGRNLREAACGITPSPSSTWQGALSVISRSDSTLRGHFPGEVDALANALFDATRGAQDEIPGTRYGRPPYLLIPAFIAGGRYTVGDVHYVAYADELIPAGETEFAADAAFGYRASNLREWIEEKTQGAIRAANVASISIDDIRTGGPECVKARLMVLQPGSACIVNAAGERDLEIVALGCLLAEAEGHAFLYRTAASFARARAGITHQPLLTKDTLVESGTLRGTSNGGLIVVGSHVPRTSGQLQALLDQGVSAVEISVAGLLDDATRQGEIARCAHAANETLTAGRDVVLYTSRTLIAGADVADSLAIGKRVSEGLTAIVLGIAARPRYVLAKGGITSSDLATKGLNVRRAMVLGQLLPGVPVWTLGPESRYPGLIYVVFPGNVGGPMALIEAHQRLSGD